MAVRAASSGGLLGWVRKTYYNLAAFNQLGLMYDDTLMGSIPEVEEAVRRLPADDYNERCFRIKRALDLSLKHRVLPKEQWTKFEQDVRYLKPYILEVQREMKEKAEWNAR